MSPHLQVVALLLLTAQAKVDNTTVTRLIEQLASSKYEEREAAAKKLEDIGEAALPGLRKTAAEGKTLEIKRRAERTLIAIEGRAFRERWRVHLHDAPVNRVSLSPDGKLGLSAGDDNRVFLWNAETGQTFAQLSGARATFSSNGKYVLRDCTDHNELQLWSVTEQKDSRCPLANERFPRALSRDGRWLFGPRRDEWAALAVGSGPLRLLDLGGKELLRFETGDMRLGPVAFSPDDRYVLVGGGRQRGTALLRTGALLLADTRTGRIRWRVDELPFFVSCVAFAPDGKTALIGGRLQSETGLDAERLGAFLHVIDVEKGKTKSVLQPSAGVSRVAYCCAGRRAIVAGDDGTLQLWHLGEGRPLFSRLANPMAPIHCLALAADGRSAVTGDGEGTIRLWQLPLERSMTSP